MQGMKLWYPALSLSLFMFISCMSNPATAGMQVYSYGHFVFHHRNEIEQTLQDIAAELQKAEQVAYSFFEVPFSKTDVYIYPEHRLFKTRKYGVVGTILALDWYIGDNIKDKVLLLSPDHPTKVHSRASILGAAGHEYVHTVMYRLYPHCPLWLNEGLALYLTNGSHGAEIHQSMEFPPEKILTSSNPLYFANHNGYSFADSFIAYIVDTYGKDALMKLLERGDYPAALGTDRSTVYQGWKAWLSGRIHG